MTMGDTLARVASISVLVRVGVTVLGTGMVAGGDLLGGVGTIIDACIVAGVCRVRGIAMTVAAGTDVGVDAGAIMGTKTIAGMDVDVGVDADIGIGLGIGTGVGIVISIDVAASDDVGSAMVNTDIAMVVVSVGGVSVVINVVVGIIAPLATCALAVGAGV